MPTYIVRADPDERLLGQDFVWTVTGPDYHEVSRTRVYLFPGGRRCIQIDVTMEDLDGDCVCWKVTDAGAGVHRRGSVDGGGQDDHDKAFSHVSEAVDLFLEDAIQERLAAE